MKVILFEVPLLPPFTTKSASAPFVREPMALKFSAALPPLVYTDWTAPPPLVKLKEPKFWVVAVVAALNWNKPLPLKIRFLAEVKLAPAPTTMAPPVMVIEPVPALTPAPDVPSVSVPVPFLISAPLVAVSVPVIVRLPVPATVRICDVRVRLARMVVFVAGKMRLLSVLIVAAPVKVAAPKVTPVAPEVTKLPTEELSVPALRESVPRVKPTPAPALIRSGMIEELALTIVGRAKFTAPSLASCKLPPASVTDPWPRALAETVARTVPALIANTPLKVLLLETVSRLGPALVRFEPAPLITPLKTTSELTVTMRVVPAPRPIVLENVRVPLSMA